MKRTKYMLVGLLFMIIFMRCSQVSSFNNLYDATKISAVKIKTFNGNISIVAHDSAYVKIGDDQNLNSCFQDVSLLMGTLTIETIGSLFGNTSCDEMKIYVPRRMKVIGSIAAAHVNLQGLEGNVDFDIGFGSLQGSVASKEAVIELAGGSVDLSWSKNLNQGSILIYSGMGDIKFSFPQDMIINPAVNSALGQIESHVKINPLSQFILNGNLGLSKLQLSYN